MALKRIAKFSASLEASLSFEQRLVVKFLLAYLKSAIGAARKKKHHKNVGEKCRKKFNSIIVIDAAAR